MNQLLESQPVVQKVESEKTKSSEDCRLVNFVEITNNDKALQLQMRNNEPEVVVGSDVLDFLNQIIPSINQALKELQTKYQVKPDILRHTLEDILSTFVLWKDIQGKESPIHPDEPDSQNGQHFEYSGLLEKRGEIRTNASELNDAQRQELLELIKLTTQEKKQITDTLKERYEEIFNLRKQLFPIQERLNQLVNERLSYPQISFWRKIAQVFSGSRSRALAEETQLRKELASIYSELATLENHQIELRKKLQHSFDPLDDFYKKLQATQLNQAEAEAEKDEMKSPTEIDLREFILSKLPQFVIGQSIGSGGMGKVYLGFDLIRGTYHAIKILEGRTDEAKIPTKQGKSPAQEALSNSQTVQETKIISHIDSDATIKEATPPDLPDDNYIPFGDRYQEEIEIDEAMGEGRILAYLQDQGLFEYIPKILKVIKTSRGVALVMEYEADKKPPLEVLKQPEFANPQIRGIFIKNYIKNVGKALDAIRPTVLHRDVKPGNILADKKGEIRLIDFGIAVGPSRFDNRISGTPRYMNLERMRASDVMTGYDSELRQDVFAMAVILCELILGKSYLPYGVVAGNLETIEEYISSLTQSDSDLWKRLADQLNTALADTFAVNDQQKRQVIIDAIGMALEVNTYEYNYNSTSDFANKINESFR